MIKPILQSCGSIVLSLIAALILLSAIESVGSVIDPFPTDVELTPEVVAEHVANSPAWVLFLLGIVGWSLTIPASCWLATRYGTRRHPAHGIVAGILLFAGAGF